MRVRIIILIRNLASSMLHILVTNPPPLTFVSGLRARKHPLVIMQCVGLPKFPIILNKATFRLPKGLFPSGFPAETLYAFLDCSIRATCPAHLKMDRGNVKSNTAFALMTEENHENNPNQFCQHRDLNSELPEHESNAMNFDRRYALCIEKPYRDRTSQSAGGGIRAPIINHCNDATVRTLKSR